MINDLKLGFKMLRYAHAVKSTLICSIIFMVVGVLLCGVNLTGSGLPGGYFLMLPSLFLVQMLYSVNMSNLVQASPMKKRMQTSVPAVICTFCMLTAYFLTVLIEGICAVIRPDAINSICGQIIFTAISMGLVMFYTGICYKYFISASVMFLATFFLCFSYLTRSGEWRVSFAGGGWTMFGLVSVIGLAVLLACGGLQYLLSLAVYKAPLSKRAQSAALRRQL